MTEKDAYFAEYWDQPEKQAAALQQALANREAEIELYWKRTGYFWTLSAAALAGYFTLTSPKSPVHASWFASLCIACLGLVLSTSWFFVNKGSKFWQENWENHVVQLSTPIMGSIFSKILHRPSRRRWWSILDPTRPSSLSVSKLNQWVSLYVICFWLGLIAKSCPWLVTLRTRVSQGTQFILIVGLTVSFIVVMYLRSRSSLKGHSPVILYDPSRISN